METTEPSEEAREPERQQCLPPVEQPQRPQEQPVPAAFEELEEMARDGHFPEIDFELPRVAAPPPEERKKMAAAGREAVRREIDTLD